MKLLLVLLMLPMFAYAAKVDESTVYKVCKEKGFSDCKLVNALAKHERGYNARKFNPEKTGSMGLMQIQCGTAKMIGYRNCKQLFNASHNLAVGMDYLDRIKKENNIKNVRTWLAAWNAGAPIVCKKYNEGKCKPGQFINQAYVNEVYAVYKNMKEPTDVTREDI